MAAQTTPYPPFQLKARSVLLWGLFLSLAAGSLLGLIARLTEINPADAVITPILYTVIMGLLSWWMLRQLHRLHVNPRHIIGRLPKNQKWRSIVGLVVALLVFSLSAFQVSFSLLSFVAPAFVEAVLRSIQASAEPQTAVPWLYNLLTPIVLIVVAPITEEFLFRGVLLQRWATKWNIQTGLLLSSVLFGLMHANVVGLSMFGLVMGLLYLKSRTLFVPIACHALNNLAAWSLGLLSDQSNPAETLDNLEKLRSSWWGGLLLMAIATPWLVRFIHKNFPRKDAVVPYVFNAAQHSR